MVYFDKLACCRASITLCVSGRLFKAIFAVANLNRASASCAEFFAAFLDASASKTEASTLFIVASFKAFCFIVVFSKTCPSKIMSALAFHEAK